MEYARFLRQEDYLGLVQKQHLSVVTNNFDDSLFVEAEIDAEMEFLENLRDNYEIEKELSKGKGIFNYDTRITYPKGSFFWYKKDENSDRFIVRTLHIINGSNSVEANPHWELITDPTEEQKEEAIQYSQMKDYYADMVVKWGESYYLCKIDNGYSFDNIRIPDRVAEDKDADVLEIHKNIIEDDPRNQNIKKHFARISLYNLYKKIAPKNISLTIANDYENSLTWLNRCNKLKINPGIERITLEDGTKSSDWVLATESGDTGYNNVWFS